MYSVLLQLFTVIRAETLITEVRLEGEITNPYGRTKGMLEQILTDLHTADPEWNVMPALL